MQEGPKSVIPVPSQKGEQILPTGLLMIEISGEASIYVMVISLLTKIKYHYYIVYYLAMF